jgi:hypothetical protein
MDIGAPGASEVEDSETALAPGDEPMVDEADIDIEPLAAIRSSLDSSDISIKGFDAPPSRNGLVRLPIHKGYR